MGFLHELWRFLSHRKKLWMLPLILVSLTIGGLLSHYVGLEHP